MFCAHEIRKIRELLYYRLSPVTSHRRRAIVHVRSRVIRENNNNNNDNITSSCIIGDYAAARRWRFRQTAAVSPFPVGEEEEGSPPHAKVSPPRHVYEIDITRGRRAAVRLTLCVCTPRTDRFIRAVPRDLLPSGPNGREVYETVTAITLRDVATPAVENPAGVSNDGRPCTLRRTRVARPRSAENAIAAERLSSRRLDRDGNTAVVMSTEEFSYTGRIAFGPKPDTSGRPSWNTNCISILIFFFNFNVPYVYRCN